MKQESSLESALDQDETKEIPLPASGKRPETPSLPPEPAKRRKEAAIDVAAAVRSRARTMRASDLARRHENVRVITVSTIRELIKDAVQEALLRLGKVLGEAERRRLLEEAEDGFQERLASFQAEKAGLEAQARNLQERLQKAQALLEEERQKVVSADQFTVSDAGMVQIETRLGRMLDRAVKAGGVSRELEREMQAVMARLLDEERGRISEKAREAQSDAIELLERKISRLARSLEETERERDRAERRASALESAGGGLRNVLRGGIDEDDPDKEKKLNLLKEIFQLNKTLRDELAAAGRLPPPRRTLPSAPPAAPLSQESVARCKPAAPPEETSAPETAAAELPRDPDDLAWEPPAVVDDDAQGGATAVQRIRAEAAAPPPLERSRV
jgi:hypothetical protein